jgi:small subunit ribosomal protein S17
MPKRTLQGVVVSDKQDKTVVVRVERRFTHPVMKKTVRSSQTFHAHDEKNEFKVGDIVRIEEHRPISKLKHWLVIDGQKLERTEAPLESESEKRPKRGKSKKAEAEEAAKEAVKTKAK